MSMHGARREIQKLRARIAQEDRDFVAAAPPVDSEGMPNWDGSTPLSAEGFMRAMGFAPDEELTEPELEARHRLSPYREIFARLDTTEEEEGVIARAHLA